MKQVQNLQKCDMFKMNKLKLVLLLIMTICTLHPSFSQTQTQTPESRKAAELKRLETALGTAKIGLERAEKKTASADSLLATGPELIKQGKADQKQIASEKSVREKGYHAKVKSLDKQMKSKDKNEVAEARKEFKSIDTQYKADLRELVAKERDALKRITTGENNKNKGKMNQKSSREALKRAQTTLETAQAKLDAAQGGDNSVKAKRKK